MQTMGVSDAPIAAIVFRLTVASVSPKSVRRSEWPMMTYSAPASLIIAGADLAGERALALPEHVLRRHRDVAVARRFAAACSAVNGGATTTVTSLTSLTRLRSSLT